MAWEIVKEAAAPLTVNIEAFEGPLDLLLHLIKKNEIEISDIPIALVTRQYLEYLELMRSLDISIAGEYLEMAATLLYIKSQMLLPKRESGPDEEEATAEDPRELLKGPLEALLEIKELAKLLLKRPMLGQDVFTSPGTPHAESNEDEINLGDLTLYELLRAYLGAMERKRQKRTLLLEKRAFRIEDEIQRIRDYLGKSPVVSFFDLLGSNEKVRIITVFMAILELAKNGAIRLVVRDDEELVIVSSASSSHPAQGALSQT